MWCDLSLFVFWSVDSTVVMSWVPGSCLFPIHERVFLLLSGKNALFQNCLDSLEALQCSFRFISFVLFDFIQSSSFLPGNLLHGLILFVLSICMCLKPFIHMIKSTIYLEFSFKPGKSISWLILFFINQQWSITSTCELSFQKDTIYDTEMVNVFHSFDLLPCFIVDFSVLIGHTCPFNR